MMVSAGLRAVRVIGLAVVGLLTFLSPPSARGGLTTQIVAYAVICAGVAVWTLADLTHRTHRTPALPVALGAITVAGCAGAAVGGGGEAMVAFSAVAVMIAAEAFSAQVVLPIVLLGILGAEIGGIIFRLTVSPLLGYPLLLLIGVLFGRNRAALRIQAEQASQLLLKHQQLRAEQRRADVLEERARIAREIHDVLAHSLGALGIQLQTVRALFTVHHDPERALEALATAQRMASGGLTETRRAVHALRADTLPLPDELARAIAEVDERHHINVRYETSGTPLPLPPQASVALLRIAQESLVNAVKHAPGEAITVDLDYRADGVRLTIANPLAEGSPQRGNGADALRTLDAGYGLTGMRERLLLLRGSLEAGPRDGRWVVTADLPLSVKEPA